MKKAQKKGFTIVELLVVIAVIAVLAAVLIPVMITLIDDAKVSNDEQIVSSLNRAIAAETGDIDTMSDAVEAASEYGYDVEKLSLESDSDVLVWDQDSKYFGIVTTSGEEVYSNGGLTDEDGHLWVITDGSSDTAEESGAVTLSGRTIVAYADSGIVYSSYLAEGYERDTAFTAGVDVGRNEDLSLTVNAAYDGILVNANGGSVTVAATKAEYAVSFYGETNGITLESGTLTVTSGSSVSSIVVTATDADKVSLTLSSGASVDAVAATSEVLENSVTNNAGAAEDTVDETELAYSAYFSGGVGTVNNPFLIGTADDWTNINKIYSSYSIDTAYCFKQTSDLTVDCAVNYFAGTYDGGSHTLATTWIYSESGNYTYLWGELYGYAVVKDLDIVMDDVATSMFCFLDWAYSKNTADGNSGWAGSHYGAEISGITFSASNSVTCNATNFGFVCINAIAIDQTYEEYTNNVSVSESPTYKFSDIISYVNLTNEGTSTGVFVGSGYVLYANTSITYENCVNEGTVIGSSYVGFLYGNPYYSNNYGSYSPNLKTSTWTVTECQNNGSIISASSSGIAAFAPGYSELNETYQDACGGYYLASNVLSNGAPDVYQNGTTFTTTDESYTYKLVLSVNAVYWVPSGTEWSDSDTASLGSVLLDDISHSNNQKQLLDIVVDSSVTSGDLYSFYAYDYNTAISKGIISASDSLDFDEDEYYAIVTVDGVNYIIFNYDAN